MVNALKTKLIQIHMIKEKIIKRQTYPKPIRTDRIYEPSIQERIDEMKVQDSINNGPYYTNKQYREFAIEEYLENHDSYIELTNNLT